ncbi:proline dehydrogenase [Pseudoclavibacter sp. RFBG4]|uniref:(2Fe-2S)-binding protein n=1 Tax=unclassified Pseudoclavibacter TaxID=2615177 RepID=UPI000CE7F0ED|nr:MULTISPECIES: (2Fe-2S)-binding protein [unclassified Pseudoclavibacter]MBF4550220.1 (2Fe-2S)-binding protein [Pseudoclavibacter sp. VKM Ac-2888]PPF38678.1 proline dehydrogenase [Pseudoclavibacter sp. AY1H1]PPF75064.1 proline dehydrogenase [Pseudoclavibacter sp. Z016]PPG03496.1 proline dehydrogenase [Pseudoclavibacter sp. RFBI5]PPG30915.1 proline dehydrogenase [Pseudoclavibacter sp. RFBG4]
MSERADKPVRITVDGETVEGLEGQSIAGVLLGSGRVSWRETAVAGKPRGLFCGIGVCFDCLVTVDGVPDVRACQRRACEGDEVSSQ